MPIRTLILSIMMMLGGLSAYWLVPRTLAASHSVDLASMLPTSFGTWHTIPNVALVTAQEPNSLEQELYSQVVMRAFEDESHNVVMLLLAYGPTQTDHLQLHRPEICYVANGFRVGTVTQATLDIAGDSHLPVKRLVATREDRIESITYWMRIGDHIANSVFGRQLIKLEYGLRGIVPDGLLVRTSVIGSSQEAYKIQDQFINELSMQASASLRAQLIGHRPVDVASATAVVH